VITHGWTVDGEGKAMHKSTGNAMPADEVVSKQGAEILRLWVASSDYQEDVRVSPEILNRMVDAYRKLRNTARYALGNISDFDPRSDEVAESDMWEIDRWALAVTRDVTRKAVDSYRRFDYTTVYHTLYNYATVTLSNVYIDILKDRLYTFAPRSVGRRSAQTALYRIVDAFTRLLAPILCFTADEIWENLPGRREVSVHVAEFPPAGEHDGDAGLLERWNERDKGILYVRSVVQQHLEGARSQKVIGASLEAKVTLSLGPDQYPLFKGIEEMLPSVFIVSQVELREQETGGLSVRVEHAGGAKCERCWNWSETVGQDARFPTIDARCVSQIKEGWGL
jgi:isoleucyl-tRNA synthetase